MAETKVEAEAAFDRFIRGCSLKDERAASKLTKDRDERFTVYDFPAGHWRHIRTVNPPSA